MQQALGICGHPHGNRNCADWVVARRPPIRHKLPTECETDNSFHFGKFIQYYSAHIERRQMCVAYKGLVVGLGVQEDGGGGLRKPHQSVLRCELMSSSLPLIEIEDKFNQRIIRPLCGSNDPARFLSGILIPADFPRIEFGLNSVSPRPPPRTTHHSGD